MLKKLFRLSRVVKANRFTNINSLSFVLKVSENKEDVPKFAFIISKKIDKRAVMRNKIKRSISLFLEKNILNIKMGQNYIFIVKKEIIKTTQENLEIELLKIFNTNKLLK